MNWRKRDDIELDDRAAPRAQEASTSSRRRSKRMHPDKNQIELADGRMRRLRLPDHRHRPEAGVRGSGGPAARHGHTQSVCHVDHAERPPQAWDEFVKDPAPSWSARCRCAIAASARPTSSPSSWTPTCAGARSATRCR
ncbi:MAG: hypothetical protein MZW92_80005 [Comamonadaceae bacterium]|nr:hypothetical protein [Comamonadaceae bacterium]